MTLFSVSLLGTGVYADTQADIDNKSSELAQVETDMTTKSETQTKLEKEITKLKNSVEEPTFDIENLMSDSDKLGKQILTVRSQIADRQESVKKSLGLAKVTSTQGLIDFITNKDTELQKLESKLDELTSAKRKADKKFREEAADYNEQREVAENFAKKLTSKELEETKQSLTDLKEKQATLSNDLESLKAKKAEEDKDAEIKRKAEETKQKAGASDSVGQSDTANTVDAGSTMSFNSTEDQALWQKAVEAAKSDSSVAQLTPYTGQMKNFLGAKFGIRNFSLFRPGEAEHGSGRAIDLMVYGDSAKGDEITKYLIANKDALNIKWIIWKQRIYISHGEGWRAMADRGSVTANHFDHVHILFNK